MSCCRPPENEIIQVPRTPRVSCYVDVTENLVGRCPMSSGVPTQEER